VTGVSPANPRPNHSCEYSRRVSEWVRTVRGHLINAELCGHGAVRRPRPSAQKMQTPHRGVATTFITYLVLLCPTLVVIAKEPTPTPQTASQPVATTFEVIVTGSNIPTAEGVGPNPVDTYRPKDIERLGIRNATDLLTKLPQELGSTINQNIANGGDGSVVVNLRGLASKETLVLVDGKRIAGTGLFENVDINLIPFPMIDHIDILKDGASAVYGTDAVAGVFNIFLIHKFRGVEIGGSYGNTNTGASNDAGEWEGWIKAGVGDDKTDIVVIADFYNRADIFSSDRDISSNANAVAWGGFDNRSSNEPGHIGGYIGFRLIPKLFFSAKSPPPHSAPNVETSPFYIRPDNPAFNNGNGFFNGTLDGLDGDFVLYNFAALTPSIAGADRQSFYGSFTRDICDKYLELFADFKYTRSYFRAALAPTAFFPDPFHNAAGAGFSPVGISVPIQNAFNPFAVANATIPADSKTSPGTPVYTGVRYRALEAGNRFSPTTFNDILFDVGLRGELSEFGNYFKTWNWEAGFRCSRDEEDVQLRNAVSQPGLREALLDTNPATAFNPFLGILGRNSQAAISRVYVTLHKSGQFELPLGYLTINGDLFNLPAGPVSFAVGDIYYGERWRIGPDPLNTTFNTIGAEDFQATQVNRDVWGTYQEVRVPFTSPTWNFPGFYSFEVDFAEREEWFSQNTSTTLAFHAAHSQYNSQKPKVSVRWQPLDPKYIGTVTWRATYTEAFHAPTLPELTPAGVRFPDPTPVHDPFSSQTPDQISQIVTGNPLLRPETAYEWSAGVVYSPKWLKGLTLSVDYWNISLRSIPALLGAQFIIDNENVLPGLVQRAPTSIPGELGPITLVIDPRFNVAGVDLDGIDYEAIYILHSTIFRGPDWGRLTFTVNGTYLNKFDLTVTPGAPAINLAGQFLPASFTITGSLPRNRAYFSLFWEGPADSWLGGFDVVATVHYTGQYHDAVDLDLVHGQGRLVREWITLDLIASYAFNLPPPGPAEVPGFAKDDGKNVTMYGKNKNVPPVSTAEYNPCGWRAWLNGTTITVGMLNVFDQDPPFVAGAFENNYDESIANVRGRFWYVQVKKRF
jgi:iron complex outermembrane recepter protein